MNQIRQGDVLFVPIDSIPEGAVRVEPTRGRYILALGETSGHAHVIDATPEVELYEKNGTLYCRNVGEAIPVQHIHQPTDRLTGEHGTLTVPRRVSVVRIQNETTPDGIVRPVID